MRIGRERALTAAALARAEASYHSAEDQRRRAESNFARALAAGIRERTGATIGLGITGIAGPTGGTDSKPVCLVYIAVSDAQRTDVLERNFRGSRNRVREWAAQQALDLVRRRLM